jgi:hypothetical protein
MHSTFDRIIYEISFSSERADPDALRSLGLIPKDAHDGYRTENPRDALEMYRKVREFFNQSEVLISRRREAIDVLSPEDLKQLVSQ